MKITAIKNMLENNPQLFPITLGIVLIGVSVLVSPGASEVAYKTNIYDSAKIAFKYMNGGF